MQRSIRAPAPTALINEILTPAYLTRSLLSAARLRRIPRGKGETVLVWPGFGATNASTTLLRGYLQSLGYRTEGWKLGRNRGDVLATLEELKNDLLTRRDPNPVKIIGWSLGGYLAREVARDCQDQVERIITLGSPVVGGPKYTAIARAFEREGRFLDEIERLVDERYATPLEVPVTALFSKSDGVVAWEACIDDRSPNVQHMEVVTSHTGFGFDARVFQIIADRLAHGGEIQQ